jgi:predicted MFS family arabinose efflux permease
MISSATVASVIRTVVMAESMTIFHYDMTWNGFYVWLWLIVEINLAVMCISIPVLRPLVRKVAPCLSGSLSSRGTGTWNVSFASGSILGGPANSNSGSKPDPQRFSDAGIPERNGDGSKHFEYLEKDNVFPNNEP